MAGPLDDPFAHITGGMLPPMEVTPDDAAPAPEANPWGDNPFATATPAYPMPKAPEPVVPNDEGFWGTTSGAATRGYYGLRENVDTARFDLAQRQIARIDETERKRAASGLPLPESLARTREELRASIAPLIASAAGYRAEGGKTRPPKDVEAALQAKSFSEAWENFKKAPVSFIYTVGLESMVRNAPGLAAAIPAGIVAGPVGAGAVMGASSGASEYASGIIDALAEEGVDVRDPKAIEAATSDPARMERIRRRSAIKAGFVGGFDALSAGAASRYVPGIGGIANPYLRHGANAAAQMPIQGTLGAAGEGLGSLASGQEIQPGAILGEFFGEAFGTPGEIAAMRHAGRHGRIDTTANPSPTEQFNATPVAPADPFAHITGTPTASPTEAPVAPAPVEGPAAETPPAVTPEAPARAVDDLGLYSAALEAAKEWKQPRGTPQQAIKYLKSKGVKDAEIEATGLESFLDGKKSVTREELTSFLEQNRTRLKEARYAGDYKPTEGLSAADDMFGRIERGLDRDLTTRPAEGAVGKPKFENYSLIKYDPTNPTYVERVVYRDEGQDGTADQRGTIIAQMRDIERQADEARARGDEATARRLDDQAEQLDVDQGRLAGHFPQPRQVGHYQATVQKNAAGEDVLVGNQIQSDPGQKLRDKGVRDDAKIAALRDQHRKAEDEVARTGEAMKRAGVPGSPEADAAWPAHARAMEEFNRIDAELYNAESAVTGHPTINTTDQWVDIVLSRMIKDAVDSGAKYIAIPSGQTVLSYNPGKESGMEEFYDKIVPKNLMNLLRKMDPSIKPTKADTLKSHDGKKELGKGFTTFPITDKVREAVAGGQPMYAKTMANRVADQVLKGKPFNVLPAVYKKTLAISQEMNRMLPPGTRVAAATKVELLTPDEVVITIADTAGNRLDIIDTVQSLRNSGALFGPLNDGIPTIISYRFDLAGNVEHTIRGQIAHEGLHALWDILPADVRTALLSHGDSLGIMATDLKTAFTRSGYPHANEASTQDTLFAIYHQAYRNNYATDAGFRDAMNQEVVAHMLQWYVTGGLTPEQVAPVKHLLDGMLNGDFARGVGQPQSIPGIHVGNIGAPEQGPMSAITAYHGSPYDFDEFSSDKIGTGEGFQAYGRGLYFADNDKVGQVYKDTIYGGENSHITIGGQAVPNGTALHEALTNAKGEKVGKIRAYWQQQATYNPERFSPLVKALEGFSDDAVVDMGRLYEVSIDANPDQFLDYDKPLSEQSEHVRKVYPEIIRKLAGRDVEMRRSGGFGDKGSSLINAMNTWTDNNHKRVTDTLRQHGIVGVRYADAMSRDVSGIDGGTSNYVVFDDKLIKITKKDGKPVVGKERSDLIKAARKDGTETATGPMSALSGDGRQRPQSGTNELIREGGIRRAASGEDPLPTIDDLRAARDALRDADLAATTYFFYGDEAKAKKFLALQRRGDQMSAARAKEEIDPQLNAMRKEGRPDDGTELEMEDVEQFPDLIATFDDMERNPTEIAHILTRHLVDLPAKSKPVERWDSREASAALIMRKAMHEVEANGLDTKKLSADLQRQYRRRYGEDAAFMAEALREATGTPRRDASQPSISSPSRALPRPQSALSAIRSFGGIQDPKGELRAILGRPSRAGRKAQGNQKGYLPGVINKNGMPLDRARERLIEMGYLAQDSDINAMYDMIERMARGERVVAQQDMAAELDLNATPDVEEEMENVRRKAQDLLSENGLEYNLTEQEERRVYELMREGMAIDDAMERAYQETIDGIGDESIATPQTRGASAPQGVQATQGQPPAPSAGNQSTGPSSASTPRGAGTGQAVRGPQPQGAAPLIPPAGPVASATPPGIPPTPPQLPLTGGGPGGFRGNRATSFQNLKRNVTEYLQNSEIRVRDIVEQAEALGPVKDEADPYLRMTLFHGRVGDLIEKGKEAAQEIINDSQKLAEARGTDLQTVRKLVNEYLIAQHAPERNAQHGDGAAGMTNAEAAQVMAVINSTSAAADIKAIADKALALNRQQLELLHDAGVISDFTYNTLNATYQNHVPLNRIMEDTNDVGEALGGQSLDVRGTGIKRAKGSDREVADVLGNIILNYEHAVLRSEKNIVDNATANFVQTYQSEMKDIAQIKPPPVIGQRSDGAPIFARPTERDLEFYRNGVKTWITFKDKDTATAFRAANREPLGSVLRGIATVTRIQAGLMTRFNPEFAAPNKIRDLQEVLVYMSAQDKIGAKGAIQTLKGDPASIKAVTDWARGLDTPATRQYEEMKRLGGTTGGMGLSTRQEVGIKLEKLEKLAQSKGRRGIKAAIDAVDTFNSIFEDSSRLSVYKAALAAGLSKERAAMHAKESSINFNRFGTAGQTINGLYMFANASMQGTAKMARAMKNPKVAGAVISIVALAVAGASSWNDQIDKDWRKKVTKWDRLNGLNFVIPSFGKAPEGTGGWIIKHNEGIRYISIPVSWGLKPLLVMGNAAYDAAKGVAGSIQGTAEDVLAAMFQAFNPLGGTSPAQILSPTISDIPVDVYSNMKWSGSRIRPEGFPNTPDDVKYFKNLGDTVGGRIAIATTRKLQETWPHFEVSPANLHYVVESVLGGPGRTLGKIITTAVGTVKGDEVKASDYPMWSRFYRSRDAEEVGMEALRGPGEEVRKTAEDATRKRFHASERAEREFKELKKLDAPEAERRYESMKKEDRKLAGDISKIATKDKKEHTSVEAQINRLPSDDGTRARHVYENVLKDIKTAEERKAKIDDFVRRKVISPRDRMLIGKIERGEPLPVKPPKVKPIDFDAAKKRDEAKKKVPAPADPFAHITSPPSAPADDPFAHIMRR